MSDVREPAAATLREERKVVTALFADIVGSTPLGERLEAEEVRLIVGDAVGRIVAEIEQLGGHLKDLAGDGVLAFFGAPRSYEDDAERAVRAALRIVDEMRAYAAEVERGWGVDGFSVRVGVCTGPVVLGAITAGTRVEYAAFGDTVNTAARLQSAAEPGMALVDAGTRRTLEPLFEWSEPRPLQLKGKAEPVAAAAVLRALPTAGKVRGLQGIEAPLVGRESELAAALQTLDRTLAGSGGVLIATGEAGIGKSRLLAELRRHFEDAGEGPTGLWLEGRCVSYGESLPYGPFRELVREWVGAGRDDAELRVRVALRRKLDVLLGERSGEAYPYLGAMLGLSLEPEAVARIAELSPEALQYRTFEVVEEVLRRLATDRPVVVALEDLHWADATSIELAERLLAIGEESAVLLVVAQRRERDHASWRLRELAAREYPHLVRELDLEPLSGNAQRELLLALVGESTLPEDLERRLLEQADGNPFYLEELVRSLADAGALVHSDSGWSYEHDASIEIPATVEKVLLARIDRLSAECHDVLTAASALGRRFGLALLEGVVGGDVDVHDALHALQRLDLVRESRRWPQPEYTFKHALIQEAAYRTLLRSQRRDLHRRAAKWLEGEREGEDRQELLGVLAHHWLAAEDEEKAVKYLTQAGDRAREEYALTEAVEHYRALLPLLERRGERQAIAVVLFKLALALHMAMRFREANEAYQRAFRDWERPAVAAEATAELRIGVDIVPFEPDATRSYAPPNMQLQMALFDRLVERWPEATIVPWLAESWEIADDGLRYVFRLRDGLRWSDGTALTAHDVEYGVKRTLDPANPGVSVSVYYVLANAQDYALGRHDDETSIGVRALDERRIEFRLAAPAPYFLSVVNRPDAGPQPRHAIEAHDNGWADIGAHVVSGAFSASVHAADRVVLDRRDGAVARMGNVRRVMLESAEEAGMARYERDELDLFSLMPTATRADVVDEAGEQARFGPPAWTFYLVFDHDHPVCGNVDFRRALAHATDRESLEGVLPSSFSVATGGIVPPALQGHTPDIAPRFDPEAARTYLAAVKVEAPVTVATTAGGPVERLVTALVESWRGVLDLPIELRVIEGDYASARMRLIEEGDVAPAAWFPGYPDPEYYLRLLLHSEAADNRGRWSYPLYDDLIERARHESDGRRRLELFHEADRVAVGDQVAVIPLAYARNAVFVKPWVRGWWEFGKSWSSFGDLLVER